MNINPNDITLRDLFAAAYLSGMAADPHSRYAIDIASKSGDAARQHTASVSYKFADAMLAERVKGGA